MTGHTRKNILATVTYYDVLSYPLTLFEVHHFLMNYHNAGQGENVPFIEVFQKLGELRQEGRVEMYQGFWFLPGKKKFVEERIKNEKISVAKLKRMKRLISLLRFVPFVRMIGGTGSLALRQGTRGSDWDMFVVLEERALFTGRFFLTLFLHIIGKRRHGIKIRDRACLNYFTGSKSLTVRLCDWYGAHEYQLMIPFFHTFSSDAFYRSNRWISDFRSQNFLPVAAHRMTLEDTLHSKKIRSFLEKIFFYPTVEKFLAEFQKKKIAKNPQTQRKGACIIADNQSLVFFPSPRGPKVFEEFQKRLSF